MPTPISAAFFSILGDVAGAAVGRRIPAIGKGVDEDVFEVVSLGKLQQAVQMVEQRMNADIAAQAHKVHFAFVLFYEFDAICELLVFEKRPVADGVA